ncbi:ATP-binding cassette domain-containing protein [Streptomyces sp. SID13666]|uniref:ABC transporter transmembrane domain-containing protein n=1 Tax=unclassified Streptomyces TaxID=2593676 RepID=UPI0013C267E4|nr:ATP-binding cassette domain-containing protein [Streptomyces sp. SID13666]NEA71900.1 ATP-binding cassette domain-containing protein [Streptomyces sp. SID13588]
MNFRRYHTQQSGDSDCGPACARTVLRRHGLLIETIVLRDSVGLGHRGSTLARLRRVLTDYGVECELLLLDIDQLEQAVGVAGPTIVRVHVDSQPHFIVVHAVRGGRFTVSDPLFSRPTVIDASDLAEVFSGHALVTGPATAGLSMRGRIGELRSQRVLWPLVKAHWPTLITILALTAVVALVAVLTGIFLQVAADRVLREHSTRSVDVMAVAFAGAILAAAGVNYLRGRMSVALGQSLQRRLSEDYVRKLLRLPLFFHNGRRVGDLVSRINDVQEIQTLVASTTVGSAIDVGVIVSVGAFLTGSNPMALAVVCVSAAVNVVTSCLLFPSVRTAAEEALQRDATLKAEFFNVLRGYEQVVSFAARDFAATRVLQRLDRRIAAESRLGRLGNTNTVLKSANLGLTTILVVWICLHQGAAGTLSVGQIFSSVALAGYFLASVDSIAALQITFQHLSAAVGRYRDVMNQAEDPRLSEPPHGGRPVCPSTDIEVSGLAVTYPEAEHPAVKEVSLTIGQGTSLLLAGPNGRGKSTALKAVSGFFANHGGSIRIGGTALSELSDATVRDRVLYVGESALLLAADIRENLTFGQAKDEDEIRRACRLACFDTILAELPGGLDWLVREDGSGLSRGQIQRLALARAILRDPDVYLFDEAFSGIDRDTVGRIWANLAALPASKVVVSHTGAADLAFDRILELSPSPAPDPIPAERT